MNNVNDAPIISGTPSTNVYEDSAYNFTPTGSDVDVGDSLTFSITNKPTWASFDTSTGILSGVPGNSDIGSTANIVISVSDGMLTTSLPSFTLTVNNANANNAPTIFGIPNTSVNEDSAYNFTPTASDVDVGDILTFSIINKPTWASFDTSTGILSGVPNNSHVGSTTSIEISVSDTVLTASLSSFTLTVNNINDAPIISGTPNNSVNEDSLYNFTPSASDVDVGDILAFSITNKPKWVSFNSATGRLSGVPNNSHVGTTLNIVVSVSDGVITNSLSPFNLTVNNVNDAPVISGSPATSVSENEPYLFIPNTSDIDLGDTLTFSITNKPAWATFDPTTGTLSGLPDNIDVSTISQIIITVNDGVITVDLPPFSITVINVNDAPEISGTPQPSVLEDELYEFLPTALDIDAEDILNFNITNQPEWADFEPSTGLLSGVPDNSHVGITEEIVIEVSDGMLTASLTPFSITVTNVNDPPEISGSPATSVLQDETYEFLPTVLEVDLEDNLTFSIINKPVWASFDTTTGMLSGVPARAHVGSTTDIEISVTDGIEVAVLPLFNLEVLVVNIAPVLYGQYIQVFENESVSLTFHADDLDGDELMFSITELPDHGILTLEGNTGEYTPQKDYFGADRFSLQVTDGFDDSEIISFDIYVLEESVLEVNDTPTEEDGEPIRGDGSVSGEDDPVEHNVEPFALNDLIYEQVRSENTIYQLNVLSNDNGENGLNLVGAFSLTGEVEIENGILLFDLQGNEPQPYMTVGYVVKNKKGQYSYAQVTIVFSGLSSKISDVTVENQFGINEGDSLASTGEAVVNDLISEEETLAKMASKPDKPVLFHSTNSNYEINEEWEPAEQKHNLKPVVTIRQDAITGEGWLINIPVDLSGTVSDYPVVIPYQVSGSSDQNDHDLIDGELLIEEGVEGIIPVHIFEDYVTEPDETLTITLNKPLNVSIDVGEKSTYTLTIVDRNLPPNVSLTFAQNEGQKVIVTALVRDPNKNDEHYFSWSLVLDAEKGFNQTVSPLSLPLTLEATSMFEQKDHFAFLPNKMEVGLYKLSVTVTDDNIEPLSNTQVIYLHITNQLFEHSYVDINQNYTSDVSAYLSNSILQYRVNDEMELIRYQPEHLDFSSIIPLQECSKLLLEPCSHEHKHICVQEQIEASDLNGELSWKNGSMHLLHLLEGAVIYSF